jgi:hypothetical protein
MDQQQGRRCCMAQHAAKIGCCAAGNDADNDDVLSPSLPLDIPVFDEGETIERQLVKRTLRAHCEITAVSEGLPN